MTPEVALISGMFGVLVAALGAGVKLLEHRHDKRMAELERKNDSQHAKGYGLLESIDIRTMGMDEKLDLHGERIAVVEVEVANLKTPKITVESAHNGHGTTTTVQGAAHQETPA